MLIVFDNKIALQINDILSIQFVKDETSVFCKYHYYEIFFRNGEKIRIDDVPFEIPFEDVYPEFVGWFQNIGWVDDNET